jgi:drug/metabolite transporter (DMT)-like permease
MSRKALFYFVILSFAWGVPYFFIKVAVEEVSPATIVFARTAVGAVILVPLAMWRRQLMPAIRAWRWVLIFAIIEMMLAWWLLSSAETHVTSAFTGIMMATVPLIGTSIARLRGDRSVTHSSRLVGLGVGTLGVAFLWGLDLLEGYISLVAVVMLLVVAVCYAIAPVISTTRLRDVPGLGVAALSIAMVAVVFAIPGLVQVRGREVGADTLLSLAGLGIFSTALAFAVFFPLVAEIGPVRMTLVTYINPAVAVFLGVLLLSEPFTVGMALGFPLVLLGSWLAGRQSGVLVRPST